MIIESYPKEEENGSIEVQVVPIDTESSYAGPPEEEFMFDKSKSSISLIYE